MFRNLGLWWSLAKILHRYTPLTGSTEALTTSATGDTCPCPRKWSHWRSSSTAHDCTRRQIDRRPPSGLSSSQQRDRWPQPRYLGKEKNYGEELPHGKKIGHSQSWVYTQATATKTDSCFHSPGSHLGIYGMSQSVGIPKSHKGPRASNQVAGLCGSILLSCEGRSKFKI